MSLARPIRVLIVKTSLDGHWRGPAVVSAALRDAGMEVIYGGVLNPEQTMATAIQEDVDVIGLHIGGSYGVIQTLLESLSGKDFCPLIVAGGTIPSPDIPFLKALGIHKVFPPGSNLMDIVRYIKENAQNKSSQ